jgi:hypothetical protein
MQLSYSHVAIFTAVQALGCSFAIRAYATGHAATITTATTSNAARPKGPAKNVRLETSPAGSSLPFTLRRQQSNLALLGSQRHQVEVIHNGRVNTVVGNIATIVAQLKSSGATIFSRINPSLLPSFLRSFLRQNRDKGAALIVPVSGQAKLFEVVQLTRVKLRGFFATNKDGENKFYPLADFNAAVAY